MLDCLVIGHNELSARERVAAMEPFKGFSGGYGDVVRNYVFFRGRWRSYIDLFNYAQRAVRETHTDVDAWGATNLAGCYLNLAQSRDIDDTLWPADWEFRDLRMCDS